MQSRHSGFSLLEMVVAVAILGLSVGMLYQSAGGSVRSVSTSEDYAYAVTMARSLLAQYSSVPPAGVSTSAETHDGYRWQVRTEAIANPNGEPVLYAIEATISWGNRFSPREYVLSSIVPVRLEPSSEQ